MTQDQERRLIAAFNNVEDLLGDNQISELIEQAIVMLNRKAGELEKNDMPRTKGSTNKKKNSTSAEVAPVPTSVAVPEDRIQLITEWKQAADQLAEVKAKEASLRQAIVAQMFDGTKLEGSESVDIGYGFQLRAKKELAYNASDKEGQTRTLVDLLRKRDVILADSLIRWKPDVATKIYRQVLALAEQYNDTEILAALHAAITLKPGMPQLEMVPPKQDAVPVVNTDHPTTVEGPTFVLETDFVPE